MARISVGDGRPMIRWSRSSLGRFWLAGRVSGLRSFSTGAALSIRRWKQTRSWNRVPINPKTTGHSMTGKRRPRRSNQSLTLNRGIESLKTIYWTESKLRKLLRRLVKNDRQKWFAARVKALNSWPERTKEQILDDASRINPRRLMDGRWAWPKRELEIQRELLKSAPENRIDLERLRAELEQMDTRTGERLVEMLAESAFLQDTTVPLETGLPQPREIGARLLRRIKRQHKKLMADIDGDSDGDIASKRPCEVPAANLKSSGAWWLDPSGWWWTANKKDLPR
jgi:hypothetical protein